VIAWFVCRNLTISKPENIHYWNIHYIPSTKAGKRKYMRIFRKLTIACSLLIVFAASLYVTPVVNGQTVIATIPVGARPDAVGVNPVTNTVYVTSLDAGTVSVIDGSTNAVTATVPIGFGAFAVGVNSVTNRVYAANYLSNTVFVIDGSTNTIMATVTVGTAPQGIAVNPVTNRVYAANWNYANVPGTVSVIDGSTNTVTATVTVGTGPHGIDVNPSTNRIYVANYDSNTVSVIDGSTNTVTATVTSISSPLYLGVNPATNRVYVPNVNPNTVSVIDGSTNTVTATVAVERSPYAVGVNPATNRVYASNQLSNTVSFIDGSTNTVTATVTVGSNPTRLGVNSVTSRVYVANFISNDVSVIQDVPVTLAPTTTSVVCNPATVAVNQPTQCTATVTSSVPITGGTVTFSSSNSGVFTPSNTCAVSPLTSSCSVSYTPSPGSEGTHVITGTYSGDSTHSGSFGSFSLTVTKRTTTTSVSCAVAFLTDHHATPCTATVTDTSPGTPITPSGTVAWKSSGKGTFSSNPCTLSGTGGTATCIVTYTASPGKPLPQTITGTYSGDADHSGSKGTTPITTP
jgi:YVTN family beta-propeller protein